MADAFRRVGRGGAGNYISENGNSTSQPSNDLETQKLPAPAHVPPEQPQHYARAGRGGAGNFHDTASVPEESREQIAERSGTAVVAPLGGRSGLMGRGGAGNWSDIPTAQRSEEMRKEEELADKVVRNVDAELAIPPKIYTSPLKEDA